MKRLRVGLVGYGAIGRHHARNLATLSAVDFVGIAESGAVARAEAASHGYRTFPSCEALLAAGIDAAVLAVPTALHEALGLQFLQNSVATLIEKPIADNAAAGQRLIETARRNAVPLMIGYVERYNPAVIAAKRFIEEGNLGEIISITTQRVGLLPPRVKDANVLVDIGVHDIDAVAFICERPLTLISAQGGRAVLNDRLDYAMLMLSAGNTSVSIATNWVTPVKRRKLSVTGLRGYAEIDYITQEASFAPARDFAPTESYEVLVSEYRHAEMIPLPVHREEPLRMELEAFIEGVMRAGLPDPAIALESLRIAEEATTRIEAALLARSAPL